MTGVFDGTMSPSGGFGDWRRPALGSIAARILSKTPSLTCTTARFRPSASMERAASSSRKLSQSEDFLDGDTRPEAPADLHASMKGLPSAGRAAAALS